MENIKNLTRTDIYYDIPFEEVLKMVKKDNFFHSRINDGEFTAIRTLKDSMNVNGMNSDFSNYFYPLAVDLMQVLLEYEPTDNYLLSSGSGDYNFGNFLPMFQEAYQKNPKLKLNQGYFYYDLLMHPPYFEDFNNFLKQKKIVIVGPAYMKDLKLFDNFELIEVPRINAYLTMNDTIRRILEYAATGEPTNFCFASGMMTCIIFHRLVKIDKQNSYFNIGSVWDYFFQSGKYNDEPYRITHRGIYPRLVAELNQHYGKYIIR